MVTVAARLPLAAGIKVMLIVQYAPTARLAVLAGQVLFWLKSLLFVPVMAMLEIVKGTLPVFVSVTI